MPLAHRDNGATISRLGLNAALPILWNISLQFNHGCEVFHHDAVFYFKSTQVSGSNRTDSIMFLFDRDDFCDGNIHVFISISKTHQSSGFLCFNRYERSVGGKALTSKD